MVGGGDNFPRPQRRVELIGVGESLPPEESSNMATKMAKVTTLGEARFRLMMVPLMVLGFLLMPIDAASIAADLIHNHINQISALILFWWWVDRF